MTRSKLLVLAVVAQLCSACPNPYVVAYRSLASLKLTAEATRNELYTRCHQKRLSCWKENGAAKTPAYDKCWASCRGAEENWVKVIRPAINTGLVAGDASIQVAKVSKLKPDWLAIVRPIACALALGMQQWQHLLSDQARAKVEAITIFATGVACPSLPAAVVEEKRPAPIAAPREITPR